MSSKLPIYSQLECLLKINEKLKGLELYEYLIAEKKQSDLIQYISIAKTLMKNSNIQLDISRKEFSQYLKIPLFKAMMKSGSNRLKFNDNQEQSMPFSKEKYANEIEVQSIHYYEEDQAFQKKMRDDYGLFCSDSQKIQSEFKKLNRSFTLSVNKDSNTNQFRGWDILFDNIGLPVSDAIITDNYILKHPRRFRENIISIITHLYQQRPSNKQCHLSVFVMNENDKSQIQRAIQNIKDSIAIPNLKMTFYLTESWEPHDRNIITNYYWLHSGHSFNYYYRGKVGQSTTLHFDTIVNSNRTIHNMLSELKRIIAKLPPEQIIGDDVDENRLLV